MKLQRIPDETIEKIVSKEDETGRKKVIMNSEIWQEHIRHCDKAKNSNFFIGEELEREKVESEFAEHEEQKEKIAIHEEHGMYGSKVSGHGEGVQCVCGMRAILTPTGNVEMVSASQDTLGYQSESRQSYAADDKTQYHGIVPSTSAEYESGKRLSQLK